MALHGLLREGAGGSGVAALGGGVTFVSSSVFGCGLSGKGRATVACVACNVIEGVPNSPVRNAASEQLHLFTLTSDGRSHTEESGPLGRGIWFEAQRNDFYAIGQRAGHTVFAKRWGTPNWDVPIADAQGANSALAASVLQGTFAAGIDQTSRLIVFGKIGSAVMAIDQHGTITQLLWNGTIRSSPAWPNIGRLAFQGTDRLLVVSTLPPRGLWPRTRDPAIFSFRLSPTSINDDRSWGNSGSWRGPTGFTPVDLLAHPDGSFWCVGWTGVASGAAFTVIRIASDGLSDSTLIQSPTPVAQPFPIQASIDSAGGLLVAMTSANPLTLAFGIPGLAEVGIVVRWARDGALDTGFGFQSVCFAQHLGYPTAVRGLTATAGRFFLACDRPASIESQYPNTLPVVFAFDNHGHTATGFGETGIVYHNDVPASIQLHDAAGAVAVGTRRIWNTMGGEDQFELAVTSVAPNGNVLWRYGTTHGMQSAPLMINGQRSYYWINAFARWGNFLAIGGGTINDAGFVAIRNGDGTPLSAGTTSVVQTVGQILALETAANGELEVTYVDPADSLRKKRRMVANPGLMFDTTFQAVTVPPPSSWITLPDGSSIQSAFSFDSTFNNLLRIWLYKVRPDGSVDPAFGGGSATIPTANDIVTTSFSRVDNVESNAVLTLPGGGYCLVQRVMRLPPLTTIPQPDGIIVTVWRSSDGTSDPSWTSPFEDHNVREVTEAFVDPPDGIVIVGARGTAPSLQRILIASGRLDPAFGTNGVLSPILRSDNPAAFQTGRPILDQQNGTKLVPVIFEETLTFAWLDIT